MEIVIICGIVVVLAVIIFLLGYLKAPPDTALYYLRYGEKADSDRTGWMENPAD